MEIRIEQKEQMNLLGLMVGNILENKIEKGEDIKALSNISGNVGVSVGNQDICLSFNRGTVKISRQIPRNLSAKVSGPMKEFLDVSIGKNPVIPFFKGKFKIKGNPQPSLFVEPDDTIEPDDLPEIPDDTGTIVSNLGREEYTKLREQFVEDIVKKSPILLAQYNEKGLESHSVRIAFLEYAEDLYGESTK